MYFSNLYNDKIKYLYVERNTIMEYMLVDELYVKWCEEWNVHKDKTPTEWLYD